MAKKIDYGSMYTLRSDGRYQGYWKDEKGKRHALCDKDPKRLYARLLERENPAPFTFKEIADAWHDKHWERISNGTKTCYGPAYKRAVDRYGEIPAEQITPSDIYSHLAELNSQRFSQKTIATQKTVYKLVYENAIIDERFSSQIKTNPIVNVPMPTGIKPSETREAPDDDVVKIIVGGVDEEFGLFPFFLLHTGFRLEEAAPIQWADVDFIGKTVSCNKALDFHASTPRIKDTKTTAGKRVVPLLKPLEDALLKYKPTNAKGEDLIFPGQNGKFYTRSSLRRRWLNWCKAVGLVTTEKVIRKHSIKKIRFKATVYHPAITPHQLRHGYCTILYEAGVDELSAMQLMGHSDYETTRKIYTHLRQRHMDNVMAKLNDAFSDGTPDGK